MQRTRQIDAGDERQRLARQLADWKAAGFKAPEWAHRWHTRMQRLARLTGRTPESLRADLEADAQSLTDSE